MIHTHREFYKQDFERLKAAFPEQLNCFPFWLISTSRILKRLKERRIYIICLCMYVCMCVYIYIYMVVYIHTYICIYIYI